MYVIGGFSRVLKVVPAQEQQKMEYSTAAAAASCDTTTTVICCPSNAIKIGVSKEEIKSAIRIPFVVKRSNLF